MTSRLPPNELFLCLSLLKWSGTDNGHTTNLWFIISRQTLMTLN